MTIAAILIYLLIASAMYGVAYAEDHERAESFAIAALWPFALVALLTNYLYTRWKAKQ